MIKAVLFDLDGTLLPMDLEKFLSTYFEKIGIYAQNIGFESKSFLKGLWAGTYAMISNDGKITNEQCFWNTLSTKNPEAYKKKDVFDTFYKTDFDMVKHTTTINPLAKPCIELLRNKGYKTALATNPLFPPSAICARIGWAGLSPDMFDTITTYDNSYYAKPSKKYFLETAGKLDVKAEECIMVGNDIDDDMQGSNGIMQQFLVTDWMVNEKKYDIDEYPHGTFEEFFDMVKLFPTL